VMRHRKDEVVGRMANAKHVDIIRENSHGMGEVSGRIQSNYKGRQNPSNRSAVLAWRRCPAGIERPELTRGNA
jgi:hypothetical protein